MDAIKNVELKKESMFEDESPSSLYIVFFIITAIFLIFKYQRLTGSIIAPLNSSEPWKFKTGQTTGINVLYLLITIISQLGLLIIQTHNKCGNYGNSLQILAQGGTSWGIIFTIIFILINFVFSSWKGPFSNTIGYEIASRVFNLEKKEEFLANFLNDPKNITENSKKSLVNVLRKIVIDGDKKSIRQLINGITLDDFTLFINKSISEKIIKDPFKSQTGGRKKRNRKRSVKRGGADPTEANVINSAQEEKQAEAIANEPTPPENAPATETPAAEATATETPAAEAPATETPAAEATATETPAAEAPATETPAAEATATETESPPPAGEADTIAVDADAPNDEEPKEPDATSQEVEDNVMNAIKNLFRAICLKDIISEFIWLSLAGSLSILVSYTFLLQQKCSGNQPPNVAKIIQQNVNEDSVIKQAVKDIKKRSKKTDEALRKESFTMLNDSNNKEKSFNKEFKEESFWLGQPYKSSLELGDFNKNLSKENRDIEKRISEQGITFLSKK